MLRKNKIFYKVHMRLTISFTAFCTLILIVMSVCYLCLNYQSIYNNSFLSFSTDIKSIEIAFSSQKIISYDWMKAIQINYNYSFYVYDNEVPLCFTTNTKSEEELKFINDIKSDMKNTFDIMRYSAMIKSSAFKYEKSGKEYYGGFISIPDENGSTEIYVIDNLQKEKNQIKNIFIYFTIIITFSVFLIFLLSYFFIKRVLRPVQDSQQQQAYFIAAASHEIRNPINTILSAFDAMNKCDESQRKEFEKIAHKECRRLACLTEDLLTLAESENRSFPVNPSLTELDTLLIDCYEAFIAPSSEKGIRINIKMPNEETTKVYIDAERIKQVVSIIISNAVSYTPTNGLIDIIYSITRTKHIITIADNGSGISDEEKKHIFEKFYRSDRARESRSHFGLGLAIAHEIVTMHKGKITVCDSKYGGAEFVISLPK